MNLTLGGKRCTMTALSLSITDGSSTKVSLNATTDSFVKLSDNCFTIYGSNDSTAVKIYSNGQKSVTYVNQLFVGSNTQIGGSVGGAPLGAYFDGPLYVGLGEASTSSPILFDPSGSSRIRVGSNNPNFSVTTYNGEAVLKVTPDYVKMKSIVLTSPSGTDYKISVNNDGELVAEEILQ